MTYLHFGIRDLLWAMVVIGLASLPYVYSSQLPEQFRGPLLVDGGPNGIASRCIAGLLTIGVLLLAINRRLVFWLVAVSCGMIWWAIGFGLSYTAAC